MFKIPSYSSTMIGSMPNPDAADAFAMLDRNPLAIPAWCQLPKRSFKETMIPQYSEGFPGIRIDEENNKVWVEMSDSLLEEIGTFYESFINEDLNAFAISAEHAQGFHHFINTLKASETKLPIIKGQITGPMTFGLGLSDQDLRSVWFNAEYKDVVLKGLTMKALWQIEQLQQYGEKVVIFMDEPTLSALGTAAYVSIEDEEVIDALNEIIHAVQAKGAAVGIHCCGNMDWSLLAKTDVDIMAFDAYFYGEKLALYPKEIKEFLEKGKYLAWGIVPTAGHTADAMPMKDESTEGLLAMLDSLATLFADKGIPQELLRKQMLFTPSCGMGTLPADAAERVLELLSAVHTGA